MAALKLTIATGEWDRIKPLMDGSVQPEEIELSYQTLHVGDIFRRMIRDSEFDVAEVGLTYFLRTLELDDPPLIAIPVFPQRMFRHACIFVNAESGIERPEDLVGRRLGELHLYGDDGGTSAKGILRDDYGVRLEDVEHYVGGVAQYTPKLDGYDNPH